MWWIFYCFQRLICLLELGVFQFGLYPVYADRFLSYTQHTFGFWTAFSGIGGNGEIDSLLLPLITISTTSRVACKSLLKTVTSHLQAVPAKASTRLCNYV